MENLNASYNAGFSLGQWIFEGAGSEWLANCSLELVLHDPLLVSQREVLVLFALFQSFLKVLKSNLLCFIFAREYFFNEFVIVNILQLRFFYVHAFTLILLSWVLEQFIANLTLLIWYAILNKFPRLHESNGISVKIIDFCDSGEGNIVHDDVHKGLLPSKEEDIGELTDDGVPELVLTYDECWQNMVVLESVCIILQELESPVWGHHIIVGEKVEQVAGEHSQDHGLNVGLSPTKAISVWLGGNVNEHNNHCLHEKDKGAHVEILRDLVGQMVAHVDPLNHRNESLSVNATIHINRLVELDVVGLLSRVLKNFQLQLLTIILNFL